jgi:hypothetical protein
MARDDDDALSWGGEVDDPTHVDGVGGGRSVDPPAGSSTERTTSSALLVLYGILVGAYLLSAIGWVVGIQRDAFTAGNLFFEIMYQFGEFLAVASPVLWFSLTFLLTRHSRPIIRILWLVLGLVLVAPWPFLVAGAAA